jgi:glutamate N-acetyltransferase / amino-acid N-acetyltransferase
VTGRTTGSKPRKAAQRARRSKRDIPARSPLAPTVFPMLPPIAGVALAAGAAGIRYKDRDDVLLVTLAPGTQVAGVFTQSKMPSAAVDWCKRRLPSSAARGLVVNSGNANAFTGKAGAEAAKRVADAAAAAIGCATDDVLLASTGVIGEPLPSMKIVRILGQLTRSGAAKNWRAAAEAIMTTDTYPKLATATAEIAGRTVRINGIAKGSGMIAPDMATLLAFLFTDAKLPASVLQEMLAESVRHSFNSVTVDSDTSTSDTVLLFATGAAANATVRGSRDRPLAPFREALNAVLLDLALQVVRDGEGARKLIAVEVFGAVSDASARRIAFAIGNSPLVKTAIAGGDANWGRVVMAVGKAGEPADRDRLEIRFGDQLVAEKGSRAGRYEETAAARAVSGREVRIAVDIGLGKGCARIYTCDFTEGYIRINASYRS